MPVLLVSDALGRFVGLENFGGQWADGLGNLLLRAGVELSDDDMPTRIYPAEAFQPQPKTPPEPKVRLLEAGVTAPDFEAQTLDGSTVRIEDFRGKVVVLDFWATWCGPCKAAMPHVQAVAAKYRKQGVVVIASCTSDEREKFEQWILENESKYPDVVFSHDSKGRSPDRAARALYGVGGIPTQFVIDRDGRIAAVIIGYREGEVLLDAALAKAGIKVDPEIFERAKADQARRDGPSGQDARSDKPRRPHTTTGTSQPPQNLKGTPGIPTTKPEQDANRDSGR